MDGLTIGNVHVIDIVIGAVVIISALLALVRGFVREVLAIVGWVAAAVITYFAYPAALPFVERVIGIREIAQVATAAGIFIIALIVFSLFASAIASAVRGTRLNFLDRTLGLVFGIVRGGLIVVLAYMIYTWVVPVSEQPAWLVTSRFMPLVRNGVVQVTVAVPDSAWAWLGDQARYFGLQAGSAAGGEPGGAVGGETGGVDAGQQTEQLSTPQPQSDNQGSQGGYEPDERSQLQRLLDGFTGAGTEPPTVTSEPLPPATTGDAGEGATGEGSPPRKPISQ